MKKAILLGSAAVLGICAAAATCAQTVSLGGTLGDKAVLIIDGVPRTLARGASHGNVRLIAVSADTAQVAVGDKALHLQLGGASLKSAAGASGAGADADQVVMTAGSGGHFVSGGRINGQSVSFLVDTGATYLAMSQAEADRLGVRYRDGQRGMAQTANGAVPVHRARLASVRIGEVQLYDVDATIVPMQMDQILLGNNVLSRFQMKRENDTLTLVRRY
jgi:aspartyl protease family protein